MAEPTNKPDADLVKESSEAVDAIRAAVKETLDVATLMQERGYNWRHLVAALVMIATGGGIVFVAKQPSEPTPEAGVAKALEGIGPAIAKAIDKQTEVLKAPSPTPPVPPPQPPTSGLELVPSLREVRVGEAAVFSATCKEPVTWHCEAKCDRMSDGKLAVFVPTIEGDFPIAVSAVIDGKAVVRLAMVRAGKGPRPPPEPEPNPPVPGDKGPFGGADGLHVLIVYESAGGNEKLTRDQYGAIYGKQFRDYIEAKCVKVNGTPQRRIYDKDVVFVNESLLWQNAMKRPRVTLPWIAVGNGLNWHEGPLPKTEAELMELMRKYGG